ncbi:DNA mismatch repair protein MutS [Candidatus Woesearchaeota archaeon]|nr:DNA mismatch repair protein MutS [Candidatus Woesearchaeota archaeon]
MAEDNQNKGILDIDPDNLTPGMKQYHEVKKAHPDCLVMLRMGDFFEMFYEDAITAAKELEITLTARGKGEKRAPLAGVPFHAMESYLGKLVKKGHKVAIVEQLEDPKLAKGLVKRGLVRIVTPGTVIEASMLQDRENNYIACLSRFGEEYALALGDISTGEFFTISLTQLQQVVNELIRYTPSECILPESLAVDKELVNKVKNVGCFVNFFNDYAFRNDKAKELLLMHFKVNSLDNFGLIDKSLNLSVCGGLISYLIETQKNSLAHIKKIYFKADESNMLLDASTLRNLELLKNIRDGSSRGSLLGVLDKTITPMGARLLRNWIKAPLLNREMIERRLNAVEILNNKVIVREEIRTTLQNVYDLERLISRINYGNANPRDLLALRNSLREIPLIKKELAGLNSELLQEIVSMEEVNEVRELIEQAIVEEGGINVREGGIIKPSFNAELSELDHIMKNGRRYIQELEEKEKEKTGIGGLKIGYTKVFGYFIEVTRRNSNLVPVNYIRKQTTVNSERYITEELKLEEEKILGAEEKSVELEYNLFQEVVRKISVYTGKIQDTAQKIAILDVLCGLAKVAMENRYVRPEFVEDNVLQIRCGRHPVVEKMEERFIANDVVLNDGEMIIITGPNMAGKSTIMRQTALIVLMAQMGSFVPADELVLGVIDKIFTRVGAYDDLSSGQSTFMIEMNETAYILNNATLRSLIILDEIGRGTSTFDGVAIAWGVAEHIYNNIKAKTLFATHYHVMNQLAEKFSGVTNFNAAVKENKGEVIFLHKLVAGATDQSYGIYVAKLAGLPKEVILRAEEIQAMLEKDDEMIHKIKVKKLQEQKSLGEF